MDNTSTLLGGAVFEVLADSRCRIVLEYLRARIDEPISDQSLVDRVTQIERDAVDGAVPLEYPDYVGENLRHAVLPELAAHGIIEYERPTGKVVYRGHALIDECLQLVDSDQAGMEEFG